MIGSCGCAAEATGSRNDCGTCHLNALLHVNGRVEFALP